MGHKFSHGSVVLRRSGRSAARMMSEGEGRGVREVQLFSRMERSRFLSMYVGVAVRAG